MAQKSTPVDCDNLVKFFESHGFVRKRQRGSHLCMVKPGILRPLVIPMHGGNVAQSVVQGNLRTAGLTKDDLQDWLTSH